VIILSAWKSFVEKTEPTQPPASRHDLPIQIPLSQHGENGEIGENGAESIKMSVYWNFYN